MNNKIKNFELKLLTYIHIYNVKYNKLKQDQQSQDQQDQQDQQEQQSQDQQSQEQQSQDRQEQQSQDQQSQDQSINQDKIKLEKIGNIEIIDKNINTEKKISKHLIYLIHKKNTNSIIELLYIILNKNGYNFDFINYNYELYNVIGINNIYIIDQKFKNLMYKFEGFCKIFIFIRGQFFVHHY